MQIDGTTRRYSNKYEEETKQSVYEHGRLGVFYFLKNIKLIFFYLYVADFVISMLQIKKIMYF